MSSSDQVSTLRQLAEETGCRWVETIPAEWVDPDLLVGLPVDYLRTGPVLPVRLPDNRLGVCTLDPAVDLNFPELMMHLEGGFEPILAPASAIREGIDRGCAARSGAGPADTSGEASSSEALSTDEDGREDLLRHSDSAPVSSRVNRLILEGLKEGASDIHVEPVNNRLEVRFRLDGVLVPQERIPSGQEDALVSRIKVMARLDIAERRLPQDGNARVRVGDREVDVRVSTLPVADGERVVMRLLGRESTRFSLEALGLPSDLLTGFREVIRAPHGVIWVTGPTGSGKTTTLYAALQELDTRRRNILTIEDPVEYQLPGIGQVGVQPRIGLSFSTGLRSLLRQDPDVILVGETRDEETAEIVVRASMTGHLVFSTLHANDAVSAPLRLTDMGVEPFLVAEATRASMAQRLVRQLCPACREKTTATSLPGPLKSFEGTSVYHAVGCDACREGYMGRKGLFEWLPVGEALREQIRRQAPVADVKQTAVAAGFKDLWSAAAEALDRGETDVEEIRSVLGGGS